MVSDVHMNNGFPSDRSMILHLGMGVQASIYYACTPHHTLLWLAFDWGINGISLIQLTVSCLLLDDFILMNLSQKFITNFNCIYYLYNYCVTEYIGMLYFPQSPHPHHKMLEVFLSTPLLFC